MRYKLTAIEKLIAAALLIFGITFWVVAVKVSAGNGIRIAIERGFNDCVKEK